MNKYHIATIILSFFFALACSGSNTCLKRNTTTNSAKKTEVTPKENVSPKEEVKVVNQVNWVDWGDAAVLKAKVKNKFIILYFYDEGCGYCKLMDETTFQDPDVIKLLNENFVPVKARGEDYPGDMEAIFGVHAYPATAFLTPDGTVLIAVNNYIDPEHYRKALELLVKAMKD